ncbi:hypothetical protein EIP91_007387 [Steccherinum ochraceum]|uniref:Uncharacterized protein n=1 Tax=Steccherinum ochraceum TaxID=92696 RepID=A0A4R0RRU9_9APHY|nr:hypothetical protein EIP91_007387 [Steccherinum ochraceum]
MAQTYAWVLEQEIAEMSRKNEETVRWILEQQEREARERTAFAMLGLESRYREMMEQLVDDFEDLADHLKEQEAYRRQKAMRWHREMEKVALEEMRRRQTWRQESDSYRTGFDRRSVQEAERERERREHDRQRAKAMHDDAEKEGWRRYEEGWTALSPSAEPSDVLLTFKSIPWPMFAHPSSAEDITASRVAMFFLSPNHSEGQTRKERIKNALRRWHPDRFGRVLLKVAEDERKAVERRCRERRAMSQQPHGTRGQDDRPDSSKPLDLPVNSLGVFTAGHKPPFGRGLYLSHYG